MLYASYLIHALAQAHYSAASTMQLMQHAQMQGKLQTLPFSAIAHERTIHCSMYPTLLHMHSNSTSPFL
eukprot:1110832-Pelagomonas_calceolata.AAC.3